jgi:predicted GH43/DUF377 family glycosyl hydrolase
MFRLTRTDHRIFPDPSRFVARPFIPGGPNFAGGADRVDLIADRILSLPVDEQRRLLEDARQRSTPRYHDIEETWRKNCDAGLKRSTHHESVPDPDLRLLIGAYLTQGYAYEAAALTNPSMVALGEPSDGILDFVMSARAIGEGHISSIAFLTGSVDLEGNLDFDERHPTVSNGDRSSPVYRRTAFALKLAELGFSNRVSEQILSALPDGFSWAELDAVLVGIGDGDLDPVLVADTVKMVHWLAASNYELTFDDGFPVSEHVISPAAPAESHGMEDARFVRFVDDDGSVTYYATYTAYDGMRILPQLIETKDFTRFRMATLSGPTAYHKGMALFPRRIGGDYAALSRHDHETTFIMRSDSIRHWESAEAVMVPEQGWEAVQTGNCGSPLETEEGWLVITHGVGPMRRYVLGAVLLDLDEPAKLLGRLTTPLLEPEESEIFGYVPDVVYSCGSIIHGGNLILPYGVADQSIRVAIAPVDRILAALT